MKCSIATAFVLLTLCLQALAVGYKIDNSCKKPYGTDWGDYDMVEKAMEQAFDMAHHGLVELRREPDERKPQVNRLLQILFCKEGEEAPKMPFQRLRATLQGLLNLRQKTDDPTHVGVTVYCNMQRLDVREDGHHFDTHSRSIVDRSSILRACVAKTNIDLAVTFNPQRYDEDARGWRRETSQITICRWFLEWARKEKYKIWSDISGRGALAGALGVSAMKNIFLTDFDATNLLDKVLLHELTHTFSAGDNVDVSKGFEDFKPFKKAYGWKAARHLAKMDYYPKKIEEPDPNIPNTDRLVLHSSERNSDSIALFCSAIRLLRQTPQQVYVTTKGGKLTHDPPDPNDVGDVEDLDIEMEAMHNATRDGEEVKDFDFDEYLDMMEAQIKKEHPQANVTEGFGRGKLGGSGMNEAWREDDDEPDQEGEQGIEFAGMLSDGFSQTIFHDE